MNFEAQITKDGYDVSTNATSSFIPADMLYGTFSILTFTFGTLGNILALAYYCKQPQSTSTILYLLIIATDVITSLLMIAPGVSYFSDHKPMIYADRFMCALWAILWVIVSRLAVFLVAVLSVTRAMVLAFPLRFRQTKSNVLLPVLVYLTAQLLIALLPYMYGNHYVYDHVTVSCLWTIVKDIPYSSSGFFMVYIFCIIVPLSLPTVPVIVSCLVCVRELRKSWSRLLSNVTLKKRRESAAMFVDVAVSAKAVVNQLSGLDTPIVSEEKRERLNKFKSLGQKVQEKNKNIQPIIEDPAVVPPMSTERRAGLNKNMGQKIPLEQSHTTPRGSAAFLTTGRQSLCSTEDHVKKVDDFNMEREKAKNFETVTILLITGIHLLFNLPLSIFSTVELIDLMTHGEYHLLGARWSIQYLKTFMAVHCVALNSALNPITYFFRSDFKIIRTTFMASFYF